MFRLFPQVMAGSRLLHRNVYACYIPHLMTKHYAELTIKATRRNFLNKAVLNQNKDVIYGELRKPTDYVLKLKQEGRCPGVIVPYSKNKEEEIDIVLPGKEMKTRTLSAHYPLERVQVRVEGKDYHCVLAHVQFSLKNFIEKVYFKEYVPGKANKLTVPVDITHLELNKFFHVGFGFKVNVTEIDILCYNNEYPTKFFVDVSYVNIDRPYKIGDLSNTFPPGIVLSSKVDQNKAIFELETPETSGGAATAEQILENISYGQDKKQTKAQGGATPAAGKGEAAKGGEAAKAVPAKADAKAAPAGKKK